MSRLLLQLRTVTQETAVRTEGSCQRPSPGRSVSPGALRTLINIQRHHSNTPMRKDVVTLTENLYISRGTLDEPFFQYS